MEIIAEGTRKAKTDNLADTITEYVKNLIPAKNYNN